MNTLQLEHNKWHGNINSVEVLKKYIALTKKEELEIEEAIKIHPMLVSKYYLSLIDKKDKNDPIKKMIIPSVEEAELEGSYDTSGEEYNTKMPGLQHKYRQTALILSTNRCAAYCRFCFRKRLVGLPSREIMMRLHKAAAYIAKHKEINNVLISGGDSFLLPTAMIARLLRRLEHIPHLDFIRFATRTPVTFPRRILRDPALSKLLAKHSKRDKRIYVVTHFNHPREITKLSTEAVDKLLRADVVVSNQTVLMRGVNDNPTVLAELQNNLTRIGAVPYYVFQCRPVSRVKHHFQVPLKEGIEIVERARANMNGHAKRFKYVMSHETGKIEIVGAKKGRVYLKYHQAKDPKNMGKFFSKKLIQGAGWLDDLK